MADILLNANTTPLAAMLQSDDPNDSLFKYRGWKSFTNTTIERHDIDPINTVGFGKDIHFDYDNISDLLGVGEVRIAWDSCTVTGGTVNRVHDYFMNAAVEYVSVKYGSKEVFRIHGDDIKPLWDTQMMADKRADMAELAFGNKSIAERQVPVDGSTAFEGILRVPFPWADRADKFLGVVGLSHSLRVSVRLRATAECFQGDTDPTSFAFSNLACQMRQYNINMTSAERASLLLELDQAAGIIYAFRDSQYQLANTVDLSSTTAEVSLKLDNFTLPCYNLRVIIHHPTDVAGSYQNDLYNYEYIGDTGTVRLEASGRRIIDNLTGKYLRYGTQSLYHTAAGGHNIITLPMSLSAESHSDPVQFVDFSNLNNPKLIFKPSQALSATSSVDVWADVLNMYQQKSGDFIKLFQ